MLQQHKYRIFEAHVNQQCLSFVAADKRTVMVCSLSYCMQRHYRLMFALHWQPSGFPSFGTSNRQLKCQAQLAVTSEQLCNGRTGHIARPPAAKTTHRKAHVVSSDRTLASRLQRHSGDKAIPSSGTIEACQSTHSPGFQDVRISDIQ